MTWLTHSRVYENRGGVCRARLKINRKPFVSQACTLTHVGKIPEIAHPRVEDTDQMAGNRAHQTKRDKIRGEVSGGE